MQKGEALEVVEKAIELKRAAQEKIRIEEESAKAEAPQQADERRVQAEASLRHAECLLKEAEERTRAAEEGRERAEDARAKAEMEKRLAEEAKAAAEERCRRAEEDGQSSEAERATANEEAQRARAERDESEAAKSAAVKAADEARVALEEAQKTLSSVMMPTHAEYKATRARLQCQEDFFHFAVAGASGSGKSSLINALRGLRNGSRNPLVAKTSVTGTTNEITRYADPDQANPFVWYEVPDAGILDTPDWLLFNERGLYVFDCIIVLIDNRFTETDVAILRNCARFQIPSYIVRSKSLRHILNILNDMPCDENSDEDDEEARMDQAIKQYVAETRHSVAQNLEKAGLAQQRVYIVDKESLVQVVKGQEPSLLLSDLELVDNLRSDARRQKSKFAPEGISESTVDWSDSIAAQEAQSSKCEFG
ncbi:hypothetical protein IEO21_02402 [Rhodonia placenta]|uniref:IRG-type G domain-containing protein n=1 Tax=Rhodonia placenta TaxID=104341 RepID=A0A8H7P7T1_9APHY|nr:hypothetical protein IEO21_02402 [Postia placenta]